MFFSLVLMLPPYYILFALCVVVNVFTATCQSNDTEEATAVLTSNATSTQSLSNSTLVTASEVNDLLEGNLTYVIREGYVPEVSDEFKQDIDEGINEVNNTSTEELANVTALPEIMDPDDGGAGGPGIGTTESAVILAGTFLILAAIGYGGMIAWRRMLLVKYGTSDMLITDDVYDITDLRHFEI